MEKAHSSRARGWHQAQTPVRSTIQLNPAGGSTSELSSLGILAQEANFKEFSNYHLMFMEPITDKKPLSGYLLESFTVRKLVFLPIDPNKKTIFGSAVLIYEGAPRNGLQLEAHRHLFIAGVGIQARKISLLEAGELVDQKRTKLYVGNIPYPIDQHQLWAYFGQFGELDSASLVKKPLSNGTKGFGYVSYKKRQVLEYVLTLKHVLHKQNLNVKVFMNKGRLKKKDDPSYNSSSSTGYPSSAGNFYQEFDHHTEGYYDQDSQHAYYTQQSDVRQIRGDYDYFKCDSDCEGHRNQDEHGTADHYETTEVYIPNYSGFPTAPQSSETMNDLTQTTTSNTDSQSTCCKKMGELTGGLTCCVTIDQLKETVEQHAEPHKQKDKDQFVLSSFFKSRFPDYLPLGFDFMSSNELSSTFSCKCVGCPCKSTLGVKTICMGNLSRMQKQTQPAETVCNKRQTT